MLVVTQVPSGRRGDWPGSIGFQCLFLVYLAVSCYRGTTKAKWTQGDQLNQPFPDVYFCFGFTEKGLWVPARVRALHKGALIKQPQPGSRDWCLLWGPALLPPPPALIMPIWDKSKWNWPSGPASLASEMCEFWQNSRWADTLCVLWADSPLAQQFENLALTWGTDVRVRSKSYFSSSLACSRGVVTEHLATMGGDTPPRLPLGDTEMGALVNEAGVWWRCFPETDWCHEERSLGSAKSEWRLQAARDETLVNLGSLPHERQTRVFTFQSVWEDERRCIESPDILLAYSNQWERRLFRFLDSYFFKTENI